jgi:dephospho-CoA kinase
MEPKATVHGVAVTGPRILLTGGIGSGKSTVGRILEGRGLRVVDADRLGHAALAPGGGAFDEAAARWPQVVVDGVIDRGRLAAIVFADPEELAALEAMVHPVVVERIERISREVAEGALVVEMSVPKLIRRLGWTVVVVDAPDEVRRARLIARGMAPEDVERRMAVQPSREEWLAMADVVVDNSGGLDELGQVGTDAEFAARLDAALG